MWELSSSGSCSLAWSLPLSSCLHGNSCKWLLLHPGHQQLVLVQLKMGSEPMTELSSWESDKKSRKFFCFCVGLLDMHVGTSQTDTYILIVSHSCQHICVIMKCPERMVGHLNKGYPIYGACAHTHMHTTHTHYCVAKKYMKTQKYNNIMMWFCGSSSDLVWVPYVGEGDGGCPEQLRTKERLGFI